MPILQENEFSREKLYWHFPAYLERFAGVNDIWRTTPAGAMRRGPWKIIEFFEDGKVELYNLETDMSETKDFSAEHPDIAQSMLKELKEWQTATNAPIPMELNPEFDVQLYEQRLAEIRSENPE